MKQLHSSVLRGPVSFQHISTNRKLSNVTNEPPTPGSRWQRPIPNAPFVCSTYVSIAATCSDECRFKNNGCYVQAGITGGRARKLDEAARAGGLSGDDVIALEVALIDEQFTDGVPQDGGRGGRDLRLHIGGDVPSPGAALALAGAADRWRARGGGAVWAYSHSWASISREYFGSISVLASVETPGEADAAFAAGYTPAVTLRSFIRDRRHKLPGSVLSVVPCPAITRHSNCTACRLCLDVERFGDRPVAIGFTLHGMLRAKAARALPDLQQLDMFGV